MTRDPDLLAAGAMLLAFAAYVMWVARSVWIGRGRIVANGENRIQHLFGKGFASHWLRSIAAQAIWLLSLSVMMLIDALVPLPWGLDRVLTIWLIVAFLLVISTFVFGWPRVLIPPRFRDSAARSG